MNNHIYVLVQHDPAQADTNPQPDDSTQLIEAFADEAEANTARDAAMADDERQEYVTYRVEAVPLKAAR